MKHIRRDPFSSKPSIVRTPDVLHGSPRIDGTRIGTAGIAEWARGGASYTHIQSEFPHLSIEQIDAAVKYESRWDRRLARWLFPYRVHLAAWFLGVEKEDLR